jgi:hypothetical protein
MMSGARLERSALARDDGEAPAPLPPRVRDQTMRPPVAQPGGSSGRRGAGRQFDSPANSRKGPAGKRRFLRPPAAGALKQAIAVYTPRSPASTTKEPF